MTDHLPECAARFVADLCTNEIDPVLQKPTCGHCVGNGCVCICSALRACEQRVRMEDDDYAYLAAQAEADGRRRGWNRALDAARERIMRLPYEIDDEILIDRDEVLAWIDALRDQPADQTGYRLPNAP